MKKRASLTDLESMRKSLEQQRQTQEKARQQEQLAHAQRQAQTNLFQQHMQGVTPLPAQNRALHTQQTKKTNQARTTEYNNHTNFDDLLSDELDITQRLEPDSPNSYRQNGISLNQLKRLRQQHWKISASLDLHGLRSDEARQALSHFIQRAHHKALRCVCVIHGKGLSSADNLPVLKEKVKRWLVQMPLVLAFCQAPTQEGGSGALLILLKAPLDHQNDS